MVWTAHITVLFVVLAALLAALGVGYAYAGRAVPRGVDLGMAAFAVLALGLHVLTQVRGNVDLDFMLAAPFLVLGALASVLVAGRRQRGTQLPRRVTVWPTAMLLVAVALVVQGVARREEPARMLPGQEPISGAQYPAREGLSPAR